METTRFYVEVNGWNAEGECYTDSTYVSTVGASPTAIDKAMVILRERGMVEVGEVSVCRQA